MSVEVTIICDRCSSVLAGGKTAAAARVDVRQNGGRTNARRNTDLCATCWPLGLTTPPPEAPNAGACDGDHAPPACTDPECWRRHDLDAVSHDDIHAVFEAAKEQAGEWDDRRPQMSHLIIRFYEDRTDDEDDREGMAAEIDVGGWAAWTPEGAEIASGPETGDLAKTLADLTLCARGLLAWERIAWATDAHKSEACEALRPRALQIVAPGAREPLTPANLDAVLSAVREASRG